jgi:dihydromethanopterin reductase (acceptor)
MNILWCVSGAGHLLKESLDFVQKNKGKHKITVALSGAGYEVAQMYGFLDFIENEFKGVIKEQEQGFSFPIIGRLAKGEYDLVMVSPCTANTVAKIVAGIADSLITNIVAQAVKGKIPTYIVPTDFEKIQATKVPIMVDPKMCRNCEVCPPLANCQKNAIYRDESIRVNTLKCNACKECIDKCKYSAISFGRRVRVHIRDIDIENTRKLQDMEGIKVFKDPYETEIQYKK